MIWLIAAVVLGGQEAPGPAKQLKEVADRLHETVIEVHGTAAAAAGVETPTFGSGVLIGGGLALTTLHTVAGGGNVEVQVQGAGTLVAKVVGGFPQIDLAVLRLDNAAALPSAPLADQPPAVGDALIAMGTDEDAVSAVGVSVAAVNGDLLVLAGNRRVDSRFWGGPIFDTQGRLVAIVVATLAVPGAVTASSLRTLLQQTAPK
ncbi:MAG: trypsin-like peptidase domain-containing protein [Deltaproteobacteria bacterium]|nr:MAG: trypsin-like peptidase domain-containing protein [Deltaproteobacteria bacterium]